MSRTDKDAPWWVRVDYYKPDHSWDCPDRIAASWQDYPRTSRCTLPTEPVRKDTRRAHSLRGAGAPCLWVPDHWDRRLYTRPPRRDDRRVFVHGPDRRAMRDFCIKAKQEFSATGDVETVEPALQLSLLSWWD